MTNLPSILSKLGLSPSEQAVYVAMLNGAAGASAIMQVTGIKRPTLYYVLRQLEQFGLVTKSFTKEQQRYMCEPIEKLQALVAARRQELAVIEAETANFVASFISNQPALPYSIVHYETKSSVEQAILGTLYAKEKVIRTIVPKRNFFEYVDPTFKERYVQEKKHRAIATHALWEHIPEFTVMQEFYNDLEYRTLPAIMRDRFDTTVFIYDEKVLYIYPSITSPRAVLIHSTEHSALTRALFETVWRTTNA
jgi:sugar-specific transcriptional regulator TrmB